MFGFLGVKRTCNGEKERKRERKREDKKKAWNRR
jgi:hypothetical protein